MEMNWMDLGTDLLVSLTTQWVTHLPHLSLCHSLSTNQLTQLQICPYCPGNKLCFLLHYDTVRAEFSMYCTDSGQYRLGPWYYIVIPCQAFAEPCGHRLQLKYINYYQIGQIGVGPRTNLQQFGTNDMEWLYTINSPIKAPRPIKVPPGKGFGVQLKMPERSLSLIRKKVAFSGCPSGLASTSSCLIRKFMVRETPSFRLLDLWWYSFRTASGTIEHHENEEARKVGIYEKWEWISILVQLEKGGWEGSSLHSAGQPPGAAAGAGGEGATFLQAPWVGSTLRQWWDHTPLCLPWHQPQDLP